MKRGVSGAWVLAAVCGLAVAGGAFAQKSEPPAKIAVSSVDDLPRHTYKVEGKGSEFMQSDAPFKAFAAKVRADVEGDLEKYDIKDPTTRQSYLGVLQMIAVVEGRWDDALALTEQVRALEGKEAKRLMTGQVLGSYVAARRAAGNDPARVREAFRDELAARVGALPWATVREEVLAARSRAQIMTRALLIGSMQAQLDPVVEAQHGEVTNEMAWPMISVRAMMDVFLDLQPDVGEVYTAIIDRNTTATGEDVWTPSQVELSPGEKATPVVVAIWDSGTDTGLFSGRLWVNERETVNGKDDDGNGFVDDVNGIAFDLHSRRTPDLLHPTDGFTNDKRVVAAHTKGFSDLQAGVESPEGAALRKHLSGLKAEDVKGFIEDLGLFGNYSHGTHVAGIAAAGNPFVRLLPVRITFDYRTIPQITPSVEQAKVEAQAARDAVAYMRSAGVRVVNMSWGGDRQSIETALEQKGAGGTPEQRAALSREIFKVQRDALEEAMKGAPEILFVAAAGNSDNDNEFSELIPSGLNLANMITVGAIDKTGKPTSFTTFGKNVTLYANGFEVESYLPGGEKIKFSGTSMAAPNAANLAAKLIALNPGLSTQQVIDLMRRGATPLPGHEGRLVINPKKSVELLRQAK